MPATLIHKTNSAPVAPDYEDGPDVARNDGSDPIEVEQAYRQAFRAAAHEINEWRAPDYAARLNAITRREEGRDDARMIRAGEVAFRWKHAVAAARLRASAQAIDSVTREWWRLHREGLSHEDIARSVVPRWTERVDAWAGDLKMTEADPPPFIGDVISEREVERLRSGTDGGGPLVVSVRELLNNHPELRVPVIEGLIRRGETMNVIAPPKTGKSWLVLDLAIAVATGRPWLDRFETHQGNVLLIDNELHPETTANRVPKVAGARGVPIDTIADTLDVASLRGGLQDIVSFGAYFDALEPGRYRVIVLDAWYRFMPADTDENDNGTMASLYNRLDHHAARLGCSFVLIHHATKGSQASKAITDVGAGAGAQSRATDTHLVLRAHEETDVIVLDAAVRSWPPIEPVCLRRAFPVWHVDESLDPTALRRERSRRRAKEEKPPKPKPEPWTPERFVDSFVTGTPRLREEIELAAEGELSLAKARQLMKVAESQGLVHRWQRGHSDRVRFATEPQPAEDAP